jgi:hypothetical protein
MRTSNEIKAVIQAIHSLPVFEIYKTADNPFYKSKYADLPEVLRIVHPELKKAGLTIIQSAPMSDHIINVITRIIHVSGEWIEIDCCVPADKAGKSDAQTAGSAITYGRRYGINALLNLAAEDDDGNKTNKTDKKDDDGNKTDKTDKTDNPPGNENYKKFRQMPEDIKEAFKSLQYTQKTGFDFCNWFNFDWVKIKTALIPLVIDNQGGPNE